MIASQRITSVLDTPIAIDEYETINVLKWKNSKWKTLCPYYLKTDGNECIQNPGGILFENFYQASKVYDVVYENKVYPSKYKTRPEDLQWHFWPVNPLGDVIFNKTTSQINYILYNRWKNMIWSCGEPIRYPNKIFNRHRTQFALIPSQNGQPEARLDYLNTRTRIYISEFKRLIKSIHEYKELLTKLQNGKNLLICEIDVPSPTKKGEYSKDCILPGNSCKLTPTKLNLLRLDTNEAYGHGLVIAETLFEDLAVSQTNN